MVGNNRLLTLLATLLRSCWAFFQLPFPGTNVSIGSLIILPVVVSIVVAFIRIFFGVGSFAELGSNVRSFSASGQALRHKQSAQNFVNRSVWGKPRS